MEMSLEDTPILVIGHFDLFVIKGAVIILLAKKVQEE